MDEFLGRSVLFWTAIQTIAVCASSAAVAVTLWLIYIQVRTASKTFELDAIQCLQKLVDDFREDRRQLFTTFPLEIVLHHDQFPNRPPGRSKLPRLTRSQIKRMALTVQQKSALDSLTPDQRDRARHVIRRLNDIGQLIEDGIINRQMFLGKYHVMIIKCCHILEAIRREDEYQRGGNYGQRLLRMRHWAVTYNNAMPKHRDKPIIITGGKTDCRVYKPPPSTFARELGWAVRRWLSWYT